MSISFSFSFCWLFGDQGFLCCPDAFAVTAGTDRTIRYFDLREGAYGRSYRVSAPDVYPNTSAQHHVLYVNNRIFCINDFVLLLSSLCCKVYVPIIHFLFTLCGRFAGRNEGNAVVFEECVSVEGGGLLKDETRAPFGSPAAYSKVQGKQAGPTPAPTHHQVCGFFFYIY